MGLYRNENCHSQGSQFRSRLNFSFTHNSNTTIEFVKPDHHTSEHETGVGRRSDTCQCGSWTTTTKIEVDCWNGTNKNIPTNGAKIKWMERFMFVPKPPAWSTHRQL
ncbi:hypothetical protein DPEC_G00242070 [Dallia pectoralis]|uniref:Uncharacterized protein n=1 Tax=Dallia pectoralis TaxID=75939 RepID=A0ACC2FUV1_DALPE|nr:hypothetical protein DPEC_G00242070 [Dallia pectoralis]